MQKVNIQLWSKDILVLVLLNQAVMFHITFLVADVSG